MSNANPTSTQQAEALASALANENRRRCPRINITSARFKAFVVYPELGASVKYPVQILGEYGCKFVTTNPKVASLRGYEVPACLHLGPFKIDVKTKMVYNDPQFAAVEFVDRDQQLRQVMHEIYQLELLAVGLSPFQNFSSSNGGSTCSTTYSDDHGNLVEVFTSREGLSALRGQIQFLDVKFVWTNNGKASLRMSNMAGQTVPTREYRDQLLSVLNNLTGLHPQIHHIAMAAVADGSMM
jgi:hypothetical protein